jgi:hypothetical protein
LAGERQAADADLGSVRYLTTLIGTTDETTLRWGRPQFDKLLFGRGQPTYVAFDLLVAPAGPIDGTMCHMKAP